MQYRFAPNTSYEDLSSGRVIYHQGGLATFPVRLALEIFHRCYSYLPEVEQVELFDPLCGQAYWLTVLGFLQGKRIRRIVGSDLSPDALERARLNLSLLSLEGLSRRKKNLEELYETYKKQSHRDALDSLERLQALLPITKTHTHTFQADIFTPDAFSQTELSPDIVLTDVPYGQLAEWSQQTQPVQVLLETLKSIIKPHTVVAWVSDKSQKAHHPAYKRLERFQVGKRKIEILRLVLPE